MKLITKCLAMALSMALISPSLAGGTVGSITAIDAEKQLIEIDGSYYRVTPDTGITREGRNLALTKLETGQVVNYTANNRILKELRVLPQYNVIPH